MEIKVKVLTEGCMPVINEKGDWFDLVSAEDFTTVRPQSGREHQINGKKYRNVTMSDKLIPLGIAMQLPKGFEAIIAPRSSSYKKFGFMQTNSFGVIDESYCGNNDEWKLPIVAIRDVTIHKGDRVCQFRIQPSQKATVWQKIKWLFSSKIKFVEVDNLDSNDRGGFGSTGVN